MESFSHRGGASRSLTRRGAETLQSRTQDACDTPTFSLRDLTSPCPHFLMVKWEWQDVPGVVVEVMLAKHLAVSGLSEANWTGGLGLARGNLGCCLG